MTSWSEIVPGGGDTAAPLNMQRRLALIRAFVGPLHGLKLLDGGCGAGGYVAQFLHSGADAYGIEYEREKVRLSHNNHPELSARITQGDLVNLSQFSNGAFDAVLLNEVLEHLPAERPRSWRSFAS